MNIKKFILLAGLILTSHTASAYTLSTFANSMVAWNGGIQNTDQHSGPQPTQSASISDPGHGLSASSAAKALASSSGLNGLGGRSQASDSQFDNWSVSGSSDAQYADAITVTMGGDIFVPIYIDGLLHADTALGSTSVAATFSVCRWLDANYCQLSYLLSAGASIINGTASSSGEFTGAAYTNGEMAFNLAKVVALNLPAGSYKLNFQLQTSSSSPEGTAVLPVNVYADFYNSFGISGGAFWQAVSGTATFYETDNPSNSYNPNQSLPEPASGALLVIGLFAMMSRLGRNNQLN